jgi:hypothetical protein
LDTPEEFFSTDDFLIELLKKFKVLPGRILAKARLTKQTFEPLASHFLTGIRTIVQITKH